MPAGTTLLPEPDELAVLRRHVARLETVARWRGRALAITTGIMLALGGAAVVARVDGSKQLESCRAKLVESRQAHSALASAGGDAMAARVSAVARVAIDL